MLNVAPQQALLQRIVAQARERNVALYTKTRLAGSTSEGILEEIAQHNNVGLLLAGWPGPLKPKQLAENPVKQILQEAHTNVAVLLNRGLLLQPLRRILVPVGGGPHSQLALHLARELAEAGRRTGDSLRVLEGEGMDECEEWKTRRIGLARSSARSWATYRPISPYRARSAESIQEGVLCEARLHPYNLIVMGASEEWAVRTRLFGAVDDWVADRSPCSVLLCRRCEPMAISWLRRELRGRDQAHEHAFDGPSDPSRA